MTDEKKADETEERKKQESSRNETILVQQVNKCTIMSPDMSIQELARLLTSVGLCLADVKIRPLGQKKPRKTLDVVISGPVETRDVTGRKW